MARRRLSQECVTMEQSKAYDEVDAFKLNEDDGGIPRYFQNQEGKLLVAHPENSIATFEPHGDDKAEQAVFYLHIYNTTNYIDGLAVAISCKIGRRNYVLKAESNSINVKEEPLPKYISENSSEFIFYLRAFSFGDQHYRFESSLKRGFCLAWDTDDWERKLILKLPHDESDETARIMLVE